MRTQRRIRVDGTHSSVPGPALLAGSGHLPGAAGDGDPAGLPPDGLPIGAQIVGPCLEDRTPLKLAELIEHAFGGFVPPPMFDD